MATETVRSSKSFTANLLSRRRELASNRLQRALQRKTTKKRAIIAGLVLFNFMLLGAVVAMVVIGSSTKTPTTSASLQSSDAAAFRPIDKLTSSDVAVNVARATGLEEVRAVENQAQSAKVTVLMSANDTNIAAKPQIIDTALKSWRDIREYIVADGDTVDTVAQKFGVSADSVRWSNNVTGNALTVGNKLNIPPADGIVYTVADGDTPQTLAAKYKADADRIAADNDAEIGGLTAGKRVFIAGGRIVPVTPTYATQRTYAATGITYGFTPSYGANGYDFGWCTYYAAARSGAPGNWGNANTWAYYARLSGWNVSSTPTPGAIFQTPAGWAGHVGIVDEVFPDGTMRVSDMKGFGG